MSVIENGKTCPACECVVDSTKEGWGHRMGCDHWTWTINPELKDFFHRQPKDASPQELANAWLKEKFGLDVKSVKR